MGYACKLGNKGGKKITSFSGWLNYTYQFTSIIGHRYIVFSASLSSSAQSVTGMNIEAETPLCQGSPYNNLIAYSKGVIGVATSDYIRIYINRYDFQSIMWIDLTE